MNIGSVCTISILYDSCSKLNNRSVVNSVTGLIILHISKVIVHGVDAVEHVVNVLH